MNDVEQALEAMRTALSSGLGLETTLPLLPPRVRAALAPSLARGDGIGAAFARAHLVDAGERALLDVGAELGALPELIGEVLAARRARRALARRAAAALAYPVMLVLLASVILPLPVVFTDGVDAYLARALPLPLAIVGVLVVVAVLAASPRLRTRVSPVVLAVVARVPGLSSLVAASSEAAFLRSLGRLLGAGLGIVRALPIAVATSGAGAFTGALRGVGRAIERGAPLSEALGETGRFSSSTLARLAVAEKTGRLDEGLQAVAQDADARASRGRAVALTVVTVVVMLLVMVSVARGILVAADRAIIEPMNRALEIE